MHLSNVCRLWIFSALIVAVASGAHAQRTTRLFDDGWKFHRGELEGAEVPGFADAGWRNIDLPHDWSIEDLPGTTSPFNPDAVNGVSQGFTTGGTGWYRKTFTVPASRKGQRTSVKFDGVYMDADVWLNGKHLGDHPYGYTSFIYDITDALTYGGTNVLAVRVRNIGATSRWYSGSGIYRHVWMEVTNPLHVAAWGTYVRTEVSGHSALVRVRTTLQNQGSHARSLKLVTRVLDPQGSQVGSADTSGVGLTPGDSLNVEQAVKIANPVLWSTGKPSLYKVVTEVMTGSTTATVADKCSTSFGIRTVSFDPVHGFLLNGQPLKLKGGCFHDDHGPLGSKSYDRAEERRVQLLLASGYNAIRCSHNPPAPAFLEACDRLGLMVIDEAFDCWEEGKNGEDYHLYFDQWWQRDLQSMILRDRNHPSIILWSIGNEIPNMDSSRVAALAHKLADYVHNLEPTRMLTAAVNNPTDLKDPFFSALDVAGYNYGVGSYEKDHQRHPERIMFATESYPLQADTYWKAVEDHSYVVGDFVWTAWDYIGEASIGWRGYPQEKNFYPWNLAFCGDIDICGWKRPASYFRDALWHNGENISVFVEPPVPSFEPNPKKADWSIWNWFDVRSSWNWRGFEGKLLTVDVYSTCPEAELFVNGKSLGRKAVNANKATWSLPYEAGALKAVGYREGKPVRSAVLKTAGAPANIQLKADRTTIKASGEDISYVTVEVVDAAGVRNPESTNLMHFSVEGPGSIAGVGNANPMSTESYQLPERRCWEGRCMVVLRSAKGQGTVRLKVSSDGLPSREVEIKVE